MNEQAEGLHQERGMGLEILGGEKKPTSIRGLKKKADGEKRMNRVSRKSGGNCLYRRSDSRVAVQDTRSSNHWRSNGVAQKQGS